MSDAVILSACRTPMGKYMGGLSSLPVKELGAVVIRNALERAGVAPDAIDECIMGIVLTAGEGQTPARQAAIAAGVPPEIPSFNVSKVCGSGLKAVILAAQAIRAGDAEIIVAGGQESMSRAPFLLPKARAGYGLGHGKLVDSLLGDGLWCVFEDWHMGRAAEHIGRRFEISREEMDAFALASHQKAAEAGKSGAFSKEIVPVSVPQRRGDPVEVRADEGVRAETNLDKLAKLKAAFEEGGCVTAGNASQINDGAAALVVADSERAEKLGVRPMARIVSYAVSGTAPKELFHAPAIAVPKALEKAGLTLDEIDLVEINEAFASQTLANIKALKIPPEKVNVNGGAIALGHPVGCSGARILVTLLHALEARDLKRGLATLCMGGGNGIAMVVERE